MDTIEKSELPVEDTNAEALISKISAINLGYFNDPFASKFIKSTVKKDCIINRGYWLRTQAIKMVVERFLAAYKNERTQIISLGSGYDTLYFILKSEGKFDFTKINYVEMDLPSCTKRKIKTITTNEEMRMLVGDVAVDADAHSMKGSDYNLIGVDLRNIDKVKEALETCNIDYKVPTLVFAECVLIYLTTKESDNVIKWFVDSFTTIYFMNYEMLKLNDAFGKIMINNFESKGCQLLGINEYPDCAAQKSRFLSIGYTNVEVYDMLNMYNKFMEESERKRIEKLEWLDEFEEWQLITHHYYFSLASKLDEEHKTKQVKIAPS